MKRWTPVLAVLASMSSVQVGAALAVPLFDRLGVAGSTWLRLLVSALVLLAVARPRRLDRAGLAAAGALGAVMAANSVLFAAATDRIPLGVTVAVEFCGPLTLAVVGGHAGSLARRLCWPVLALAGVLLLTRPWSLGDTESRGTVLGLGLAALAGIGWAGYIVLLARVGRLSSGLSGLSVALVAAALVLAPIGLPQAWPALTRAAGGARSDLTVLLRCAVVALLMPLLAYALEMAALRLVRQSVFGVWMALEPALGAGAGLLLLGQVPTAWQLPGFALVVAAGIGAERAHAGRDADRDADRDAAAAAAGGADPGLLDAPART